MTKELLKAVEDCIIDHIDARKITLAALLDLGYRVGSKSLHIESYPDGRDGPLVPYEIMSLMREHNGSEAPFSFLTYKVKESDNVKNEDREGSVVPKPLSYFERIS